MKRILVAGANHNATTCPNITSALANDTPLDPDDIAEDCILIDDPTQLFNWTTFKSQFNAAKAALGTVSQDDYGLDVSLQLAYLAKQVDLRDMLVAWYKNLRRHIREKKKIGCF